MDKYLFTTQKAIEILNLYEYSTKLELTEGHNNHITGIITVEEFMQMKDLAMKALEKQTAKKVTRDSMYSPALCPNCHSDEICKDLGDGHYSYFRDIKYCPNCGQMLDWEE